MFYRPLIAELPPWIRAVVVELPTTGPNDYETLLDHVDHATRDLRDVILVGFSFSGPLALCLASRRPSRVRALVLMATFVRLPRPHLRRIAFLTRPWMVALLRLLRRLPSWVDPSAGARRAAKRETWRRVPAATIARRLRAVIDVDATRHLRQCPLPMLNLAFNGDEAVPARNADAIQAAGPAATCVRLDGHHLTVFDEPSVVAAVLLRFLAGL